jgi:hypothetical protein
MSRSGMKILAVLIAGVAVFGYWRSGWSGAWAVLGKVFDPAIVLGLIPLAFVLGAIHSVVLRLVRSLVRGSTRPSPGEGPRLP